MIRLIATERDESMPAWAARAGKFAYVTTRNGPPEIWLRNEDGSDRPLVTPADFSPVVVNVFMDPTLSPDGDRVIYTMAEVGGKFLLYISSASGGAPTRVTNSATFIGDSRFALARRETTRISGSVGTDNRADLMLVKTSGQATPSRLQRDVNGALPQWSPTGEWITFQDDDGWHLISPDGKNTRALGKLNVGHLAFSLDGKKLYGIRAGGAPVSVLH